MDTLGSSMSEDKGMFDKFLNHHSKEQVKIVTNYFKSPNELLQENPLEQQELLMHAQNQNYRPVTFGEEVFMNMSESCPQVKGLGNIRKNGESNQSVIGDQML